MKRFIRKLLILAAVPSVALYAYVAVRHNSMEHFAIEAVSGSEDAPSAALRLSSYKGRDAIMLLLEILRTGSDTRVSDVVFKELAKQNDPEVANILARFLQPHQGIGLRQSV
ncbi:MAG TPA: hypothetical protein VKT81_22445, partial [Bryobacteraceae bacterium]|nr:hypothetical protein [Bryobacteraceae bacterium]